MDTTLIVNPGSSSKKYALYQSGREIFSALFEHTENGYARCVEVSGKRNRCEDATKVQFETALHDMLVLAIAEGSLRGNEDVTRIGIRIVAPGTFFTTHRVVDSVYIRKLNAIRDAAPLHIPHQLTELALIREAFPNARIIGVSDSAFHATMPLQAKRYSIPTKDAKAFDIYRFGYHGLSVASIVRQIGKENGRIPSRIVVCHVGSGVSVTALRDGKSVDTTMGFAPTSGLMMGARAGEVDPSAFIYLFKQQGQNLARTEETVSEGSGIKGLLGNSDLRVALDRASREDHEAHVAVAMFIAGIRKAVGSMSAVLGGMDMLVLTGTAPERNPLIRKYIATDFEYLGLILDDKKNEMLEGRAGVFSIEGGRVQARIIHTDELGEIALIATVF